MSREPSTDSALGARIAQIRANTFTTRRIVSSSREATLSFAREIDLVLRRVFTRAIENEGLRDQVCVVGVGGYGRGELCPYSDIDIVVLRTPQADPDRIASFIRDAWNTGLTLGCAVRTLAECSRILGQDVATDTSFIECSYIAGNSGLFDRLLCEVVRRHFRTRRRAFLAEMHEAVSQGVYSSANSLYRIEPDIKHGMCALRDCQRLVWAQRVASAAFGRYTGVDLSFLDASNRKTFEQAHDFLLAIRCSLHMAQGRRLDTLEVGAQPAIATALELPGPGALMECYFRTVTTIKHSILAFLESTPRGIPLLDGVRKRLSSFRVGQGLYLVDGILYQNPSARSRAMPRVIWMLDVFETAIRCQATLGIELRNAIRRMTSTCSAADFRTREVDKRFRRILSSSGEVGRVLHLMHDTSFLGGLIPEFGTLTCRVEYDTYHEYTVDQHILLALQALDDIGRDKDKDIAGAYANLRHKWLLRLALLLHDIGKAVRGDHCRTGAIIAGKVCARLGLSPDEARRIQFLVFNHLEMSKISFKREPEESLIAEFAETVGDMENLNALYVLTVLDIRTVGQRTWTGWKASQLRSLYDRTRSILGNRETAGESLATPADQPFEFGDVAAYVDELGGEIGAYEMKINAEELVGFYRLTIMARDRRGLLADIVGCIASEGLGILSARVNSLQNGVVVDTFDVEPDRAVRVPFQQKLDSIQRKWQSIVQNNSDADELLRERLRHYPPPNGRGPTTGAECFVRNGISPQYTVIEVGAPDRFGVLHTIVSALNYQGVNIVTARIGSHIDRAVDVFYVTNTVGEKITDEAACESIRTHVCTALQQAE